MRVARLVLATLRAGLAWLGLGVVLADDSPGPTLGAIAALVALTGGWAGRSPTVPLALRIGACLLPVALARGLAGTAAAGLAAVCIALGCWVRLRFSDAVIVLAAIGAVVVATSHPSWRLIVAFSTAGIVTVSARPALATLRRPRTHPALKTENVPSPPVAEGGALVPAARNGR